MKTKSKGVTLAPDSGLLSAGSIEEFAMSIKRNERNEAKKKGGRIRRFLARFFERVLEWIDREDFAAAAAIAAFAVAAFAAIAAAIVAAIVAVAAAVVAFAEETRTSIIFTLMSFLLTTLSLGITLGFWGWIALGGVPALLVIIGTVLLWKEKRGTIPNNTISIRDAIGVIKDWLDKRVKCEIQEKLGESEKTLSLTKDSLLKAEAKEKAHQKDPFLSEKYGEYISSNLSSIKGRLKSVKQSLKEISLKKQAIEQLVHETLQSILPQYEKERAFIESNLELNNLLERTDNEVAYANEILHSADSSIINVLSVLHSAFTNASMFNQAFVEVSSEDIEREVPTLLESFNTSELEEVLKSVKSQEHA